MNNIKDEIMTFFQMDDIIYNVEMVITEANHIYVEAIRKLDRKLITNADFEKWDKVYKMEYNEEWYVPTKISSWLKFTVSKKKREINWTFKGVTFGGDEEREKIKPIVEEIVRNVLIEQDFDGLYFAQ